jgi:MFS family permease
MKSSRIPAVLRLRDFQALLVSRFTWWFVMSGLTVVVGYQVYLLTHDPLALGLLGLVEAFPALTLSLFGGHLADRRDRKTIIVIFQLVTAAAILGLAALSLDPRASAWPASLR